MSDLPNVLFEVSNESTGSDADFAWQNAVVDQIKQLEQSNGGLQHPVGMSSFDWFNASGPWSSQDYVNSQLFQSHADWIAPAAGSQYQSNPPDALGGKVVIADTDHIFGIGGNVNWVWQQFTRGNNVLSMDDLSGTGIAGTLPGFTPSVEQLAAEISDRGGIAETRQVATMVNLTGMTPSDALSSTGYALADPASGKYVVYAPNGGTFTVDLSGAAGKTLDVRWMDVGSGQLSAPTIMQGGSSQQTFSSPFGASALVLTDPEGLCFCRGTRIATPHGEAAVEALGVGDMVLTMQGEAMPIRWIGTACRPLAAGARIEESPVVVRAGALADGVPVRDLRLTKGHSLFIDSVLIPVESLVNGRSIAFDDRPQLVEVFHLELDRHAILIADGAPAESYRDDGNGARFHTPRPDGACAPPPCAPIPTCGPVVDRLWRRIADRAGIAAVATTREPDLHLLADGRRVDARLVAGGLHRFRLRRPPRSLRIVSRSGVPCALGVNADRRRLGVALARVVLRGSRTTRELGADARQLSDGFHRPEPGLRWTNGDAVLPAAQFDGFEGALDVELHLAATAAYPAGPNEVASWPA